MIGIGRENIERIAEESGSSARGKANHFGVFLPLVVQLRMLGVDLNDKFGPILSHVDTIEQLTSKPENQKRVELYEKALIKRYSTEDRPLSPRHFSLVPVVTRTGIENRLLFCARMPLLVGSWNQATKKTQKNTASHTFRVEGVKIDGRTAMDLEAHRSMTVLAAAGFIDLAQNGRLPDQNEVIDGGYTPGVRTPRIATYLTGFDPKDSHAAPSCFDDDINSGLYTRDPNGVWPTVGMRPGATVPGLTLVLPE